VTDTPLVTVAVSTYGRSHLLGRLVAALEAQSLAHSCFEVVVVDNCSPDDTSAVLGHLAVTTTLQLRFSRADASRGPAAGRNLAWRQGGAPVVAFTDDDCVPDPQWLAEGLRALGDGQRIVVGRTEPPADQAHLTRRAFSRVLQVHDTRFFETCNVFYRRADLEAAGGFEEGFRTPGGEDTDLGLRVLAAGADEVFAPDAVVHHDVRPGSFRAVLRETLRWQDIPLVLKRHPGARARLVHHRIFWKPTHPWAVLAWVGLALAVRWRPALVLVVPWVVHRLVVTPAAPGPRRRVAALPGAFVIDTLEVAVMVCGSVRHRTVLL